MNAYMLYAALAGSGVALMAGPLGSFIVWRRLAFFGDTLAHSTLLGVCFALFFHLPLYVGLITVCLAVAFSAGYASCGKDVSTDSLLGVFSHATLALGVILASLLPGVQINLVEWLFGDILAVTKQDLVWIASAVVLVIGSLYLIWSKLVSICVDEDLARVEGIRVRLIDSFLMFLIALVFALTMKLLGVLLIAGMHIIPAVAARLLARTPEQMAFLAVGIGLSSVALGLYTSYAFDLPTGPAIVACAFLVWCLINSYTFIAKANYQ